MLPKLGSGAFHVAAWSTLSDIGIVDVLLRAPFDGIVIDLQHGLHDPASANAAITLAAALGKPTIVRVPVGDLASVSRVLDFGASAVILPMIETAEDARALVQAAKYAPLGNRSFGPARAATLQGYGNAAAYLETANDMTLALAMIETRRAFAELDSILAVDGLDGVLVGPADLSLALTGRLDPDGAETVEAAGRIAAHVKAAGKFASIYAGSPAAARRARDQGYDLVGVPSDASLLADATSSLVSAIRDTSSR